MIFKSLKLWNFKTYYGKHLFRFSDYGVGVYHVTGENKAETELGANGIGKSNLFDGLFWTLYGKTPRGLKAGNIHSWGAKGKTSCELSVKVKKDTYKIYRSWKPNKLLLTTNKGEPKTVSQEVINDLLGLTVDEFQFTVLIGQFSSNFLDLTPTQKLSVFADVLKLDEWDGYSTKAYAQRCDLDAIIVSDESELAMQRGQYTARKEYIKSRRAEKGVWDSAEQAGQKLRVQQIKELKKDIAERRESLAEEDVDNAETLAKANGFLAKIQKHQKTLGKLRTPSDNLIVDRRVLFAEKTRHVGEIANYDNISDKCPSCGQRVSVQHLVDQCGAEKLKLALVVKKIKKLDKEISEYQTAIAARQAKIEPLNIKHRAALQVNFKLRDSCVHMRAKLGSLETTLSQMEKALNIKKVNPHIQVIKEAVKQQAGAKERIAALRDTIKTKMKVRDESHFWVKEFKAIRLEVIKQALSEFELEANGALAQLGLSAWHISFAVERETKSGDISRGFNVLIDSPYTDEAVPWESWSGGENQRLRVAVSMGLMNLVLGKKGIKSNIEIYDEPTSHLSPEGISGLLDTLRSRSLAVQKTIFLVDHHALDSGIFSGSVQITKTKKGSQIS